MRTAHVEIDKVEGTNWPPDSVEHDGTVVTLQGIFADAGFQIGLTKGDAALPVPTGGPNFDLSTLHDYMTRHRRQDMEGWHAHVLVVPNIDYMTLHGRVQPLGVMYDIRSFDLNSKPREGCGLSYRAAAKDERKYLRALAHELGHLFNLLHPKEESPPRPVDTTIMNQTRDLESLGSFPDNIAYAFDESNRDWLRSAPTEFVRPGGKPYGSRPTDVALLPAGAMSGTTPDLALRLSAQYDSYSLGEPIYARFSLRNSSNAPILVDRYISVSGGTIALSITNPLHQESMYRPVCTECLEPEHVELPPGGELLGREPVFLGAEGPTFTSSGVYRMRAYYQSSAQGRTLLAISNVCEVEIVPPQTTENIDAMDAMSSSSASLFLALRGGEHLSGGAKALSNVAARQPNARFSQRIKLALASEAASPSGSGSDYAAALRMLDSVDQDLLDLEARAECACLAYLSNQALGESKQADANLGGFRDLVEQMTPNADVVCEEVQDWGNRLCRKCI